MNDTHAAQQPVTIDYRTLDTFTRAYLECALWSSHDESDESGGEPMNENYGLSDVSQETLQGAVTDCLSFRALANADLRASGLSDEQAGQDFWLTRNGHGAGFWDRGLGPVGSRLSDQAHTFSGVDLIVGDDGMIYGD